MADRSESAARLLARAADELTGQHGAALVFGGLGDTDIPVSVSAGSRTTALTSMVIRPARGLGGQALVQRRPLAVAEYERAAEITHDYDGPVLGEGVVGLAVAPLLRGPRIGGLLYAATRAPEGLTPEFLLRLAGQAQAISVALTARTERLREIALTTRDPETKAALLDLVEERRSPTPTLTARQREVLELAEIGLRNAEIGERLGLTEQTVKGYMRALMARLGARSRQEAIHRYRNC